ncbi:unnamed protein product [Rotaria sordida]|uniref:Metalloendopeptidase n=1 Tax=Rotaria sordida TaxID=392033 RepID=A0A815HIP8_9BILA|nr:unnamed protein product [Rotaria sordida]
MFTPVLVLLTIVISVADAYRLPVVVVTSKEDLSVKKQKLEETNGTFEGDILLPPARNRGVVKIGTSVRWPNGIVPYEFATGYTAEQQAAIVSRMRKLESLIAINNVRCIQFRPRVSSDVYYITIRNGEGCSSYVGQNTEFTMERTVTLNYPGCFDDGRTMHEFIHTLGFYHEQSRPDRDAYVEIIWKNIQTNTQSNFQKYDNTAVNTLNTPYDYASIMHYEETAFSINSSPTIKLLQANVKTGQRYKLSPIDIQEIRQFYNCPATGSLLTTAMPTTTIAPSLNPSYYSSQLTINHPKFARNGGFGANYYYENLRLTVPAGGLYTFQCDSYIDSFASLYFTSFNPSNSATNLYWSIDDANSDNWEFKFAINFPSAYTMDFVVTTYSPGVTGPFQIVATGPNKATFNRISSIGNSNNG